MQFGPEREPSSWPEHPPKRTKKRRRVSSNTPSNTRSRCSPWRCEECERQSGDQRTSLPDLSFSKSKPQFRHIANAVQRRSHNGIVSRRPMRFDSIRRNPAHYFLPEVLMRLSYMRARWSRLRGADLKILSLEPSHIRRGPAPVSIRIWA